MSTPTAAIQFKPYSLKEISAIYGVSTKTMRRWLQPFATSIGEKNGRYYNVVQVRVIFEKLGVPGGVES